MRRIFMDIRCPPNTLEHFFECFTYVLCVQSSLELWPCSFSLFFIFIFLISIVLLLYVFFVSKAPLSLENGNPLGLASLFWGALAALTLIILLVERLKCLNFVFSKMTIL